MKRIQFLITTSPSNRTDMPAFELTSERHTFTSDYMRVEDYLDVVSAKSQLFEGLGSYDEARNRSAIAESDAGAQWQQRAAELFLAIRSVAVVPPAPFRVDCLVRPIPTSTRDSWASLLGLNDPARRTAAYSFTRRLSQLAELPLADRPSGWAFDVARLFDAFATNRAKKVGGDVPVTVLTSVDGGDLLIEWNLRGKTVRHFECLIAGGDAEGFSLLFSRETRAGNILRMTEIPRAELPEVLAELAKFFERGAGGSCA